MTKLLLGGVLLICLVQGVSAASLLVAASDSSELTKSQADYICDSIQDENEISAAINALPQGGEVILSEGTFNCEHPITLNKGITLRGQGDTKTFLKLTYRGEILVDNEYVTLEQFHISNYNRDKIMGGYFGVITIRASHCSVSNVTGTCDATVHAVFFVFSSDLPEYTTGYNKNIEDIEFTNCKAIDCGGHGFYNNALGNNYKQICNI